MTLTPEEREVWDQAICLLEWKSHKNAKVLAALRDRLENAEPVAWANVDRYGDHSYFGINQLPPGKHHLFTAPPAPAAPAALRVAGDALRDAVNALLHQIDIGDFVDSHGHNAKMLKPVHDLMRLLAAAPRNEQGGE